MHCPALERTLTLLAPSQPLSPSPLARAQDSWPFREAVDASVVPDYLHIVREPMDFGLILKRCLQRAPAPHYRSLEQWMGDAARVTDNARRYNKPETEYYACANKVDAFLTGRLRGLLGIGSAGAGAGARA